MIAIKEAMSFISAPRLLRDTRGQPSWTLTLAIPVVLVLTVRMLLGGAEVTLIGWGAVKLSPWAGQDYALAVGVWLGLWAHREYTEKMKNGKEDGNGEAHG